MGKITWFLVGGLIGAGAALALTPKTGEETRSFVTEKATALAGEAKDFGAGLPGSATDALKSARDQGASLLQNVPGQGQKAAAAADDADADELRAKIEAARQRIAAQVMENAEKAQDSAGDMKEAVVDAVESVEKADEAKHAAK